MTFFDRPRGGVAAHEPSPAMRWPLVVLAVPSVLVGLLAIMRDRFWLLDVDRGWLEAVPSPGSASTDFGRPTSRRTW